MIESYRVKDFMCVNLVKFVADMDVMEAVRIMVERGISGGPVVDRDSKLLGIITEKDCLKIVLNAGYYDEWGGSVLEFMSHDVEVVEDDTSIIELAERFVRGPYRRFPVVNNGRLVGQVSRHDVLKALLSLTR